MSLRILWLPLLLALTGCARCTDGARPNDAGPGPGPGPSEVDITPLPKPAPWAFAVARTDLSLAYPDRCAARAPLMRAPVTGALHLLTDPNVLGELVVVETEGDPPRAARAGALSLGGQEVVSSDLPWMESARPPRFAKAGAGWMGAFTLAGNQVMVGRGARAESAGDGDHFEAVDLGCNGASCALVTTPKGRVARPGASVWMGGPEAPLHTWKVTEIVPDGGDVTPLGLAAIEADHVMIALTGEASLSFWSVSRGEGARFVGRAALPHGVIDVASVARDKPIALAHGTPVGDDGCAIEHAPGGGALVSFVAPFGEAVSVKAPAPPVMGAIRRLTKGAIAIWLAPLQCGGPSDAGTKPRKILYGVVIGEDGKPVTGPMAIGDAKQAAISAKGDDVDVFVEESEGRVAWMKMRCAL